MSPATRSETNPGKLSRFEQIALRYYHRLPKNVADLSHSGDEQTAMRDRVRRMKRIEKLAISKAALAGALSGVAAAVTAWLADPILGVEGTTPSTAAKTHYWMIVGGVTLVASLAEIAFLYWDALVSTRRLNDLAVIKPQYDQQQTLSIPLIRAALEIPNGAHPVFGVNPLRETSRIKFRVWGLLYKVKVGLTSFLIKALVKRLFGRAVARGAIEFFAIPVVAAWNALVCKWYMQEARLRACGPFYAEQLDDFLFPGGFENLDEQTRVAVLRAIAVMVVASEDLHPNTLLLMKELFPHIGQVNDLQLDDRQMFLSGLNRLKPEGVTVVMDTLMIVAALNGRLSRREKQLILAAQDVAGIPRSLHRAREFAQHINDGSIPAPAAALTVRTAA